VEPGAAGDQDGAPPWAREVPSHGEAVLVAPASDLELVAGEAHEQAVHVIAYLLADEGGGIVPRDRPVVGLPALRIADYGLELHHCSHRGGRLKMGADKNLLFARVLPAACLVHTAVRPVANTTILPTEWIAEATCALATCVQGGAGARIAPDGR